MIFLCFKYFLDSLVHIYWLTFGRTVSDACILLNSWKGFYDYVIACVCLGQMRSMRIFYNDQMCTSGQLVIASRESQYKILHFHHGGLDRLVETFCGWKFLAQPKRKVGSMLTTY